MIQKSAPSCPVTVWMAGDLDKARDSLRKQCFEEGLCVTLDATTFVYTAGVEEGVRVGFVNYPRFPKAPEEIIDRAEKVLLALMNDLYQHSALLQTPEDTTWYTRRPEDVKEKK
jgi:hypothetical protein